MLCVDFPPFASSLILQSAQPPHVPTWMTMLFRIQKLRPNPYAHGAQTFTMVKFGVIVTNCSTPVIT